MLECDAVAAGADVGLVSQIQHMNDECAVSCPFDFVVYHALVRGRGVAGEHQEDGQLHGQVAAQGGPRPQHTADVAPQILCPSRWQ
eukprot:11114517-Alexandrium_andersonii.AAC.1